MIESRVFSPEQVQHLFRVRLEAIGVAVADPPWRAGMLTVLDLYITAELSLPPCAS